MPKLTKEDLDKFEDQLNGQSGLSFRADTAAELIRLARLGLWAEDYSHTIELALDELSESHEMGWRKKAFEALSKLPK